MFRIHYSAYILKSKQCILSIMFKLMIWCTIAFGNITSVLHSIAIISNATKKSDKNQSDFSHAISSFQRPKPLLQSSKSHHLDLFFHLRLESVKCDEVLTWWAHFSRGSGVSQWRVSAFKVGRRGIRGRGDGVMIRPCSRVYRVKSGGKW